jgi:smad nuclear-interacting protein 1
VEKPIEKEKPNWKPSGLLAAETNKVTVGSGTKGQQDIILKYHEPSEARKPPSSERWVLYVFKGKDADPLTTIPLHTRSCWLLGRETAVADIPVEHPSCSKQHAVFQFRYVVKKDEFGDKKGKVGLYVLDLESANGTMLNGSKVEAARYVECLSGDVVKFGDSEREYVLLLPPKGEKQT